MGARPWWDEDLDSPADTLIEFDYGEIEPHITAMIDAVMERLHHESTLKRWLGVPHERSRIRRLM
jgi:hypothetical protein